ncbi:hypothetical protein A2873_00140 [Candidatus Woesebacteria bacterium RIFCSPHIGHO2_01_FULL_42_80]|nr:MAG: hypothetical protein A2873_00140 [Candidatus Woesebacteria bacterium RIFCSPHIGHO2_01_FULL_42_80]
MSLKEIAAKFQNGENIDSDLEKHIEKYSWQKGPITYKRISFTKQDYLERLDNYVKNKNLDSEIGRIESERKSTESIYRKIVRDQGIQGSTLKIVEALRNFIFLRTATVESNEHLLHTAKLTLFAEIAEKTKLAYSDTLSLSPEEIVDLLVGTISKPGLIKKVKSRQMGFAIVWLGGQLFTFFGSDALKLQKVIAGKHKKQKVRTETAGQIKGICH